MQLNTVRAMNTVSAARSRGEPIICVYIPNIAADKWVKLFVKSGCNDAERRGTMRNRLFCVVACLLLMMMMMMMMMMMICDS